MTTPAAAAAAAAAQREQQRPLHIYFLHLDWGIGGAEQLMLQLAQASVSAASASSNHHDVVVQLRTTHCDPSHCFAALKPPSGALHPLLRVRGQWIPTHLLGGHAQALCSTLRLLYLAYVTAHELRRGGGGASVAAADGVDYLVVCDVLPTPLWILRYFTNASLLFYCHFPDQLLLRKERENKSFLFQWYRYCMDALEECSMGLADTIAVNSKFTQETVRRTFPTLSSTPLHVLYPALEVDDDSDSNKSNTAYAKNPHLIVSLNRFERKKNLGLLLEAVAWILQQQEQQQQQHHQNPIQIQVVIAGGYDPRNVENVQYRGELGVLAEQLQLSSSGAVVTFRQSIADAERRELLATAAAVVYTPSNEHFGIVPLEAMYAETAVIGVHSGGPVETVVDGITGFLCEPTPEAFGRAIQTLLQNPAQAVSMGRAGRRHVLEKFGPARLEREWKALTEETVRRGRQRRAQGSSYRVVRPGTLLFLCEAVVVLLLVMGLTGMLRLMGWLKPSQSILGAVRTVLHRNRDEL